jgi:predicted RNA-binding Zn-ribbon protein involved in translation (DUF1610 family)
MVKGEDRSRRRAKPGAGRTNRSGGRVELHFTCQHCGGYVSTSSAISGVQNRNHCPNCLWSRHVDSSRAGDRLAACKGSMRPVGLTAKKVLKKYGPERGELMLIHHCQECGKISINRIAADDDPREVIQVFEASSSIGSELWERIEAEGIDVFGPDQADEVRTQLYGKDYLEE